MRTRGDRLAKGERAQPYARTHRAKTRAPYKRISMNSVVLFAVSAQGKVMFSDNTTCDR